jgi:chromosome segregation ATPase
MDDAQRHQLIIYRLDELKDDLEKILRKMEDRSKMCEEHEVRLCTHEKDIEQINETVRPIRDRLINLGLGVLLIIATILQIWPRGH